MLPDLPFPTPRAAMKPVVQLLGEEVWARLRPGVMRRLHSYLGGLPHEALEDTAQEVLMGLHVSIQRHGLPNNLDGMVTVITRRKAASALRRVKSERERFVQDSELLKQIPEDRIDLDYELIRDERVWIVHRILDFYERHDTQCANIAIGRMCGQDFQTMSEAMGKSSEALRQAWSRCLKKLRVAIREGQVDVQGTSHDDGRRAS